MKKEDSVQAMLRRGREHPDRCAFCGKPKELEMDLTTVDDSATKVEVDAKDIPMCQGCLDDFARFAGNEAHVFRGGAGKA